MGCQHVQEVGQRLEREPSGRAACERVPTVPPLLELTSNWGERCKQMIIKQGDHYNDTGAVGAQGREGIILPR
jgi:hypothetical protein